MHCRSPKRRRGRGRERENIQSNNVQKLPKFDQRHEYKHAWSSMNFKQGEFKETHTETHYNKTVKRQRQRENFESTKREGILLSHTRVLNKIVSWFLIRNSEGQNAVSQYVQNAKIKNKQTNKKLTKKLSTKISLWRVTTWIDPRGHYAKWNKAVTKTKILYDLTYMRYVE